MPEELFPAGAGANLTAPQSVQTQGIFSGGVSNLGNTAGTTGLVTNRVILVGGSNVTLSQSSGVNGATVTINGASGGGAADLTLLQYPIQPWGWSTAGMSLFGGSTSANGASTHSTMSYYVQPYYIDHPVQASMIQLIGSIAATTTTASATFMEYLGLYKLSSDSLTLVSSWLAGQLLSNDGSGVGASHSISWFTGSASATIASITTQGGGAFGAVVGGIRMFPIAAGQSSLIAADQYFVVLANHKMSAISSAFGLSIGIQPNTYLVSVGNTSAPAPWAPLNGAFSSTSMTDVANSNQWLMPPAVATSDITATRTNEILRPPIMFRGI